MRRADLPPAVLAMAERGADWARWVDRLPRLVTDLLAEWGLRLDGAAMHGFTALVLPVRGEDDDAAVLKIGFPHEESEHEHLALQHWHGRGAVRLLRADPGRSALLLERLSTTDLGDLWDVEACEVVGSLYADLHRPALPKLRRLGDVVASRAERLAALPRDAPVPHRLVEQAISLSRDLVDEPATNATLLHTDLHYANVLEGPDGWRAIDPKPLAGDPHHEIAPLLWNRWDELAESHDGVRAALRRRLHAVVDAAGLDDDRARDWTVVRMVGETLWAIEQPDEAQPDWITRCVAIAKAVQE